MRLPTCNKALPFEDDLLLEQSKALPAELRREQQREIDALSPELRDRLSAAGLEAVPPPAVWLRCRRCGLVWSPQTRPARSRLACPECEADVR